MNKSMSYEDSDTTWLPPAGEFHGSVAEFKFDTTTGKIRLIVDLPPQPGLTQDHRVGNNYSSVRDPRLKKDLINCFGKCSVWALNNNGEITPEDLTAFSGKCVRVRIALKDYQQEHAFRVIEKLMPCTEPLPVNPVHSISPGIVLKQMETLMADLRAAHAAMGL